MQNENQNSNIDNNQSIVPPTAQNSQTIQSRSTRNALLFIAVVLIVGAIYFLNHGKVDVRGINTPAVNVTTIDQLATSTTFGIDQTSSTTVSAKKSKDIKASLVTLVNSDKNAGYTLAKEISQPSGFVNTPNNLPITISQYIGKKVILVDFWTYSCINCKRTQPYLNAWYDKYESKGLVIIGVHTPEFDFEKIHDNVLKAVTKENIKYPVVQDNDYATWSAYGNQYWPRKYLIDMAGYVVYDKIGEGGYDETEKKIQNLLTERSKILGVNTQIDSGMSAPADAVTTIQTQSPETYFGSSRNQYLANGKGGVNGVQNFILPTQFDLNSLYLGGSWNVLGQEADAKSDVSIVYKFNAKEVYFVAGSVNANGSDIEVLLDGKSVIQKGKDVITSGGKTTVHVTNDTLYHLIDLPQPGEHTLEIRGKAGLKGFTFTFG